MTTYCNGLTHFQFQFSAGAATADHKGSFMLINKLPLIFLNAYRADKMCNSRINYNLLNGTENFSVSAPPVVARELLLIWLLATENQCECFWHAFLITLILSSRHLWTGSGTLIVALFFFEVSLCGWHMPLQSFMIYICLTTGSHLEVNCPETMSFYPCTNVTAVWTMVFLAFSRHIAFVWPQVYRRISSKIAVSCMILGNTVLGFVLS